MEKWKSKSARALVVGTAIVAAVTATAAGQNAARQNAPRFRSAVDVVEITATVTDESGRFVAGLSRDDFSIYEDGAPQTLTQFSNQRAPVSLGILLDASGSMTTEKLEAAQTSITRLISGLLDPDDELFFGEFGYSARLTQEWTTDRRLIRQALLGVNRPTGDTALYDAIALALPTAQSGRHGKKALLVISDGNDTRSAFSPAELRAEIMRSDVLVYALGVDDQTRKGRRGDRVNVAALRQVTDVTGGRTEAVRGFAGLDRAIVAIADELRQQYSLGFSSNRSKDGKWHAIRVDVRDRRLTVRARSGYTAS